MSRLFVALVPPRTALAPLAAAVTSLRTAVPGLGWVEPERWHLTLAFLGEVTDRTAGDLELRLARVARRHPPVDVVVSGAGRFGQRALWVRIDGRLRPLATAVARAAGRVGIDVDERPYRAHLTLARSRRGREVDLRPLVASLADLRCPPWTADRLVLVRSHLGPEPRYDERAAWPLTGRRSTRPADHAGGGRYQA